MSLTIGPSRTVDRVPQMNLAKTMHFPGDLHYSGIAAARRDRFVADVARCPTPLLRFQAGDMIEDGSNVGTQDTDAIALMNSLPGPWDFMIGNHDFSGQANGVGARSLAAIETAYGRVRNRVVDLGDKLLIIVAPPGFDTTLDTTALNFLDNSLAAATKDCFIGVHCPLENTVSPTTNGNTEFSTSEAFFSLSPDVEVRAILNTYARAKVVLSGHTHSPLSATDFIKTENVGSRSVLCINASALYYVGRTIEPTTDPLVTLWLTWDDVSITARYRDHWAGRWVARPGQPVDEKWALPA